MAKNMAVKKAPLSEDIPDPTDKNSIIIEGLRQNNLKNLSLSIPRNKVVAIVGLSGSGKSSLAFDTLFAEGRWRFVESLSTYSRLFLEKMDRPLVDSIKNIPPAIAVEQKNPVRTSRSTVGTITEINDYLRLLFSRIGQLYCPECNGPVEASEPSRATERLIKDYGGRHALIGFSRHCKGQTAEGLQDELLKKGFIRVKLKDALINLAEQALPDPLPQEVFVVLDRVSLHEKERGRIASAIELAYKNSGMTAIVEVRDSGIIRLAEALSCLKCGIIVERPTPISLSFNHPVGACPECRGFGNCLKYDGDKIVPDKGLSLRQGAIEPWTKPAYKWWYDELEKHARKYSIDTERPFSRLSPGEKKIIFEGTDDFDGVNGFFEYLETKKYKLHIKVFTSRYKRPVACGACNGERLKKSALNVKIRGNSIAGVSRMTIEDAQAFFSNLILTEHEHNLTKEVLRQIQGKLKFLNATGLGYITLDRLTKTLSGGEAQRVTLARELSSFLSGVLYILDEPSIGLHPSDADMLAKEVTRLCSRGNTVIIVEHDPSMIRASDYVIELGPSAGEAGGGLVYAGATKDFLENSRTLTSDYLTGRKAIHVPRWRRKGNGTGLCLKGASGNNLKAVDLNIPLRTLTVVTGVSGSGKSTLVVDTLYNALAERFNLRAEKPLDHLALEGAGNITGVRLIDQEPIGKTPRSIPVSYIGAFDEIRAFFAGLPMAAKQGLGPGHFSFNVPDGRCGVCSGAGVQTLEMYFLPDVYVKCPACNGRRYKQDILEVKWRGKSIHDCLQMTFDEAGRFFPIEGTGEPMRRKFSIIRDVGLGYLRLGQSAVTLSGGEAQRLKIAKELSDPASGNTLYILDEPTTGLHMEDIKRLLSVLGRLVDNGNTVVVIEHNLDCIKTADFIVDLGPGGGHRGGSIIASGTPEKVASTKESLTGRYLRQCLSP